MADLYYNLNEFQAQPRARRWWPKAVAICAVLGGIYGVAIGSAIGTTDGAADVIGIAAAVMAVLCGVPGARFGSLLGILNRIHFGRLFLGVFAAMGGAILGGLIGIILVMPLGAILGAVGGWVFTGAVLRRGLFGRLLGRVFGLVLGACIGVTLAAIQRDQAAALVGIAWGMGIGGVIGPLPLLLFVKIMDSLASRQHTESNIIDAEVVDAPNDEIEGPRHDES